MQTSTRAHSDWLPSAAAGALTALLLGALIADVLARPPAYVDEPAWLSAGALTARLVAERAGPARWTHAYDDAGLRNWGTLNPPLGKLLIGLAMAPFAEPGERIEYRWDLDLDAAGNAAAGNLPPQRLLVPVRLMIALCGAAALGLLYATARQVTGAAWLSLLAPLALFASPIFRFHATRAYTDVPQLAILLGGLVAFQHYLKVGSRRALFTSAILAGLATAVKLSAANLVLVMVPATLLAKGAISQRLRDGAIVGALAFGAFCVVNPYLYPNPLMRSLEMVTGWGNLYESLRADPRIAAQAVSGAAEGFALVAQRTLLTPWLHHPLLAGIEAALPLLVLTAGAALLASLLRYRIGLSLPLRDARLAGLAGVGGVVAVLRLFAGIRLTPALFLLGAYALFVGRLGRSHRAASSARVRVFFGSAFAATFVLTALWLPFDWQRYYLRTVTLVAVVWVAGVVLVCDAIAIRPRKAVLKPTEIGEPA